MVKVASAGVGTAAVTVGAEEAMVAARAGAAAVDMGADMEVDMVAGRPRGAMEVMEAGAAMEAAATAEARRRAMEEAATAAAASATTTLGLD